MPTVYLFLTGNVLCECFPFICINVFIKVEIYTYFFFFFFPRAFWLTLLQMSFYLNGFIFVKPSHDFQNSSLTQFQSSASNYKITHMGLSILDIQNPSLHENYICVVILGEGTVSDMFKTNTQQLSNNPVFVM